MNLGGARQIVGPELYERAAAHICKQQTERSSADSQQDAFRQALTDQAAAFGAQCGANGELAFPGNGTGQKQAGDVDTRDQQNQANGGQK
jgi:hypothetical protein